MTEPGPGPVPATGGEKTGDTTAAGPRPDFLVIGAPKAGTTALYASLVPHPQLFLSRVKEPKHFLTDGPTAPPRAPGAPGAPGGLLGSLPGRGGPGPGDRQTWGEHVRSPADYAALFADAPAGTRRGEATPFYLHDLAAQDAIAAALPDVRCVAVLREPVDRAYSNWAHLRPAGLEGTADFVAACRAQDDRRARGWAPFWRYVDLGLYGAQVAHLFTVVDRERVLLIRYRDLHDEPVATLDRVCGFLGVQAGLLAGVREENVRPFVAAGPVNDALGAVLRAGGTVGHRFPPAWRVAARTPLLRALHREHRRSPRLTDEQWAAVAPRFSDDVDLLTEVTGTSYADWHTPPSVRPRRRAR